MKVTKNFGLGLMILIITSLNLEAQEVSIKLGKNEIGLNEYFTISIQVQNDRLKQYGGFPEIEGFIKRGTSSSTSTNIVNGRMSSTQSIIQNYQASAQGSFVLQAFAMTVNGKEVRSEGTEIKVGEPVQRQSRSRAFGRDPFDDFFGRKSTPTEFVDVEADAFLLYPQTKMKCTWGRGSLPRWPYM